MQAEYIQDSEKKLKEIKYIILLDESSIKYIETDCSYFFESIYYQSVFEKFRKSQYQALKLAFIDDKLKFKEFMDDESIKKIEILIMMEHSIESKEFTLMNSIYYPTYLTEYILKE